MDMQARIERWFTPRVADEAHKGRVQNLCRAAHDMALTILANTPAGADQSAAMRKVREALMTAQAGLECDGPE